MKGHVGSSLDEFLADEGLLGEAEATAVKRVIAYMDRAARALGKKLRIELT